MKTQLINPIFTNNYIDNLLLYRGVAEEDLAMFKDPTVECLQAPEGLDNIEAAALYILEGVKQNKKFGILRDCD